jgi:Bacterial type III secretion protein (HrpB1_HrpK)
MAKRFGVDLKISRLMLLIGLMCERLRRFEEGEQILRAMKAYRDDLPHPGTYLALCYLGNARVRDALEELNRVRAAYPEFQMAQVLLGIAQRDAGQAGWQRLLEEVIADGRDEYATQLARDTLGLESATAATPYLDTTSAHIPHGQRVYA